MSIKAKLIGLLTAFLLVFPTIPAIAKDANADSNNNQNVYQKLLNENVTTNPVLDLIRNSDKKMSKTLPENPSSLGNQSNTTPTQDTNLQISKTLLETPSLLGNQANTSPIQDSNIQISKTLPGNTSVYGIDLEPFKPSGWGDMLIVTKTPGQHYSDTSVSPSDELYLSYAYINNGTMSTPSTIWNNMFYVDNVPTLLSSFTGSLDPNYYVTNENVDIGKLSAGTHTIKMVLDTYDVVPEANESNNEYSITVTVTGDKADLVPFKPDGWGDKLIVSKTKGQHYTDTTFSPSDELYLSYSCINNGPSSVPDTTVYNKFYVDNVLTSTSYFDGPLDPNWYVTGEGINFGKLSAGTHTIKMVLDSYNDVSETNESNNEYSITVTVRGDADLVPFKPDGWGDKLIVSKTKGQRYTDTTFSPSDELYLSYSCINNGTSSVSGTTVYNKFYVDNVLTSSSYFDGPLDPNWYATWEDFDFGKLSAGTHTLKIVLDTTNAVTETNESNNEYSITVTVTGDKADLVPFKPDGWGDKLIISKTKGQHYTDTTISPSDELYLSYSCINNGTSSVPDTTVYNKFYVDNVLTSSSYFYGSLDPNWYITWEDINFGKLSAGTHTIKMVLDSSNAVSETNEGNNEYSVTVYVDPGTQIVRSLSADPSSLSLMLYDSVCLTLTATYTDGSTEDVTELATWSSYQPRIADVDSAGCVTALSGGSTTITGSYGGKTVTIPVNVTDSTTPELVDVIVQPETVSVSIGKTQAVKIYAVYDDDTREEVTQSVILESDDESIATVSGAVIRGVLSGETTVYGSYDDFPIEIPVTVTASVRSLSVDPPTISLAPDETNDEITLTANYTDGTSDDVTAAATWSSNNPDIATVEFDDDWGIVLVTGVANGSTTITGTYGSKTATVKVNVTEGEDYILVQPESVCIPYGKTQAVKIYSVSGDTRVDITKSVTLESDDLEIATVTRGIIKGTGVGDTFVRGTYLDQDIEIPVTVTPPVTKLTADPSKLGLTVDGSEIVTLTATYKDGSEDDVTESALWTSNKPQYATVDEYGMITGVDVGLATITGTYGGKKATIAVNVTPELDHFLVQPSMVGVAKGKKQTVTIYAVYVDGSKEDITKNVRLTSDDTDIATVSGASIKGILPDSETTVWGTYLDQDIEIPVKVTQPLRTLVADTGDEGLNLFVGDSDSVNITATYADGFEEDVNDYVLGISSKPSIATVDIEGGDITITAVSRGSTKITLSYEGKKVTVNVNVTN